MKIKTSKPKMLRFLNTALIGGLISKSCVRFSPDDYKNHFVEIADKSLQTVIMWGRFHGAFFTSVAYNNNETFSISESIHKAIKKIGASDIFLESNDDFIIAEGSSFKYKESEQDMQYSEIEISNEESETGDKYFRPNLVSIDEIEFQVFIDTEELRKVPQADKYTFVLDKGDIKVVTEDVGKLEIKLTSSSISDLNLTYSKSFSGDIFDKLLLNFDGKICMEFGKKFLILSQSTKEIDLMFAQASLVDTSTVTI
jgi:hypothetical protein